MILDVKQSLIDKEFVFKIYLVNALEVSALSSKYFLDLSF